MKTIKTAADIAALSEQDKDIVFAFDTARERLKGSMIRSLLIPCLVIAGSLLSLHTQLKAWIGCGQLLNGWLTSAFSWDWQASPCSHGT